MLSKFISLKRILINIHTASIEEAVLICGELLVKDGCTSPEYPAAMVETVRQLGDSIVMAPQTALPHAAFSKGVWFRLSRFSVWPSHWIWAEPTVLSPLLLGFCGSDAESHMKVLAALAQFFSNPAAISSLLCAPTAEELYRMLCQSNDR